MRVDISNPEIVLGVLANGHRQHGVPLVVDMLTDQVHSPR